MVGLLLANEVMNLTIAKAFRHDGAVQLFDHRAKERTGDEYLVVEVSRKRDEAHHND
jgi:hypothetical protein